MTLSLQPRATAGDRLQIWVGALDRTTAPVLTWTLDGAPANPVARRPMQSARPDAGPNALVAPGTRRVFTGVFEFPGLQPGTVHEVRVAEDGATSRPLRARTLPAEVPRGMTDSFNVLLVSCFHAAEDRTGLAGQVVASLTASKRPHLTLLLGDQVYLDLPTLENFPDDAGRLAEKFERDYVANWRGPGGYADVLAIAPSVSIPDDHEYWNNFPHPSPFIQNSWRREGRERWQAASRALYDAFQLPVPTLPGQAFELDVPPLSFLLLDTRTFRDPDRRHALDPQALQQLTAWTQRVAAQGWFGVVASGQSLFQDPTSSLAGKVGDRHLADSGDYDPLLGALVALARAGRPVLSITGDVHYGRVLRALEVASGKVRFYEVISSPTSLVTTVGKDQVAQLGAALGGLFGRSDPWPRHSDPGDPPELFARRQGPMATEVIHGQKGNQVTLLSFRQSGLGLTLEVTYLPIHRDGTVRQPQVLPTLDLVP